MAWETPKTWASEPLTSIDLNEQVRDNLNYLYDRVQVANDRHEPSGTYNTSSTSAVDVDATNLNLTITTTGGDVLVTCSGYGHNNNAGNTIRLVVLVDSTDIYLGCLVESDSNQQQHNPGFAMVISGLSAGSHTFDLQWFVNGGSGDLALTMFDVRELVGEL